MCMYDGDCEQPEFLTESIRRNRRPGRRCGECGREITVGEVYENVSGRWNGYFSTHATCAHCLTARGWLAKHCGAWMYGGVYEDLAEHWQEAATDVELAALTAGMKAQWKLDGQLSPVAWPQTSAEQRRQGGVR